MTDLFEQSHAVERGRSQAGRTTEALPQCRVDPRLVTVEPTTSAPKRVSASGDGDDDARREAGDRSRSRTGPGQRSRVTTVGVAIVEQPVLHRAVAQRAGAWFDTGWHR